MTVEEMFDDIPFLHVIREFNKLADELSRPKFVGQQAVLQIEGHGKEGDPSSMI